MCDRRHFDSMVLLGLLSQEIVQFSEHYHSWIIQEAKAISLVVLLAEFIPRTIPTAPSTYKFITLKYSANHSAFVLL